MTRAVPWGSTSVLLAALAAGAVWMLKPDPPRPVSRTVITLPANFSAASMNPRWRFRPMVRKWLMLPSRETRNKSSCGHWTTRSPGRFPAQQPPQDTVRLLPLTRLKKNELRHREPEYLPGGKGLLFAASMSSFNWYETINASSLYSRRQSPPNLFLRPGKNTLGSSVWMGSSNPKFND
jgi:hypothetical protein